MRILTLTYEFPPLGGGGSKVAHGLARQFVRDGHDVDVVTMAYKKLPAHEVVDGINVHRVPCLRRAIDICHPWEQASYMIRALPAALQRGKRHDYDIMHCHFILPDGIVALGARRRLQVPVVVTAHGSDVPGYNPDRFKALHKMIFPAWRAAARSIDRIVCPSRYLEQLLLGHEPAARTVTIPNGFDLARFQARPHRQKSILLVTRMLERKGVQDLLRALQGTAYDYDVRIVGTGPYLKSLEELAARLRLNVDFLGWLDNDSSELKHQFESSSIFVFPSHAENFPLVLLEAMAAGLAIITTDQTGCREVVGDAAVLVPAGDDRAIRRALGKLVDDDEFRMQLGRRARSRIEELFSWPAVAQQYMDVFEDLVSPGVRTAVGADSGK